MKADIFLVGIWLMTYVMRSIGVILISLSLLTLSACGQGGTVSGKVSDARARNDGPPIWVVTDADSTLYLYGTVHLLPSDLEWQRPDMTEAFDASGTIFFEVESSDKTELDAIVLTSSLGMYRDGRRLSDKLDSYQLKLLDAAANNARLNLAALDSMKPWLASEFLSVVAATEAGLDPGLAADEALKSRAERAQKNIIYLDTIESQIRLSADLPEFVQMAMLSESLSGFNSVGPEFVRVAQAWALGSTDFLTAQIIEATKSKSPEFYATLFTERNKVWAQTLTRYLEGTGTGFAAVGIGHLLGEESVQSILKEQGYSVARYYKFQGPPVIKPAFTPTYQDPDTNTEGQP